jgi:hypothetical protein
VFPDDRRLLHRLTSSLTGHGGWGFLPVPRVDLATIAAARPRQEAPDWLPPMKSAS